MGNRASLALAMGANAGAWAFSSSSSSSASGQYARLIRSLEAEWSPQELDQLRKHFLHLVIGGSTTAIAPPLEGDLVYGRRGSILNHATVSRQAFLSFLADVPEDLALFLFASISSIFPTSSSAPPERRASSASPSGSEHSFSSANGRAVTGSPTKTISLRPTRARPALEPVYRAARRSAGTSSSSSSRSRNRATSSPASDTPAGPPVISYPAFLAFLTQFLHHVSLPDWGQPRLAPPTLFVKTTHLFFAQQGLGAAVTDNDATAFFLPDRRRSTGSAATGTSDSGSVTATGGSNLVSTEEVFNILLGTLWMWAAAMTPAAPPHASTPTPPPIPPNVPSTLRSPLPNTRTTSIAAGSSVRAASILSDGFGGGGGYASVSDMAAWRSSTLASHEIETRTMRAPYERDRSSLRPLRSISFDGGSSNVILDESVSWADSDQAATATMGGPSVLTEEIEESSVSDQTTTSTALPVSPTTGGGGGGGAPQSVAESSDAHSRRSLRAASLTSTTAVYHMRIDPEDAVSHFSARPQPNATDRWSVRTSLTAPTAPRATLPPPPVVMAGGMVTAGTGGSTAPTSIPMFRLVEPHTIRDLANRILHLAGKPASDSMTTTASDTASRSSSSPSPTARPHATMGTVTAILARSLPYLYTCSFYPFLRARFVATTAGNDAPPSPTTPSPSPSPLLQSRPDVHFLLHAAFPPWPTASLAFRAAVHGFSVSRLTAATRGRSARCLTHRRDAVPGY
ncbi:hypothetical protein AMAG_14047 [Allomyces macrogynus ATCC 38327]|uniref:Uncharacterized protein n=1 Tax=Allomyces macrogynus (strain ATCC 38327) TaxID=578462 RepID=A0A0L0T4N2_ALLM3|nr:hypothetical protein AMAG_14047 [Allomyces macrogynus ATCC 38327]|eukprot:KNE69479.1 hypothetical protein AMAG_14047 [Allomyces macrogynus ATCC 38327]